jgi:hypothetical protein
MLGWDEDSRRPPRLERSALDDRRLLKNISVARASSANAQALFNFFLLFPA